jgi:hypothetical protein
LFLVGFSPNQHLQIGTFKGTFNFTGGIKLTPSDEVVKVTSIDSGPRQDNYGQLNRAEVEAEASFGVDMHDSLKRLQLTNTVLASPVAG